LDIIDHFKAMYLFVVNSPGFVFVILGMGYIVLWVWALLDLLNAKFKDPNMRLIWTVVLLFASPIGPFVYFMLSRKQKETSQKYFKRQYFNR
jgi:heme/copper-type cytochrome/quinol oxidase subunit 3